MKLYIKNMVCSRCKMVVKDQFKNIGLQPLSVELGEVELLKAPSDIEMTQLNAAFKVLGF